MATKACTGLRSSLDKCLPKCQENADYLSQLPEDIMLSIISSLTMKEAARFSLVSRRCEFIYRCVPVLIFGDSKAMKKLDDHMLKSRSWDTLPKERRRFVSRVDRALEKHLGTTIDELQITFDLDNNWQSHVDKWAAFALDKQVKRLKLNFSSGWRHVSAQKTNGDEFRVSGEPLELPPKFTGFKSFLNSLCLKDVNVTDEFIDYLFHSSPLLEKLCIKGSRSLTRVSGSLQVKHLKVSRCLNLKKVDISARKLQSFKLYSKAIELHIADASSLVQLSIGLKYLPARFAYVFNPLSEYISQLVYLKLILEVERPKFNMITFQFELPEKIDYLVTMPNLQHLILHVFANADENESIREWIPVIAASPSLQKLTLKLHAYCKEGEERDRTLDKWVGFPLKCLKTLELSGYIGYSIDLELAVFVFENASKLEEVIVDFVSPYDPYKNYDIKRERLGRLQKKLPQGVKLTVNY